MKRMLSLFVVLILILCCSTAYAHSGRTDGKGGHRDHSTGEYHYHHGYPAHDHWDMDGDGILDCPYLFDNGTDHKTDSGKDNSWIFGWAILLAPLVWQASRFAILCLQDYWRKKKAS